MGAPKVLVTGARGQIGSELVPALRARYGDGAVIASTIRRPRATAPPGECFEFVDCTKAQEIQRAVLRHGVEAIYHLAGILSAVAEEKPQLAWDVNMGGLHAVLEVAREHGLAVFFPSSIGAFGPNTPRDRTPQDTLQRPNTIYGITKLAGELLCDYYNRRFGVDTRGLRLPGVVSYGAPPGGGTTDWAVEIFYEAVRSRRYTCFLRSDSCLDMMYMPDALRAVMELMEADPERLLHRNAFNVTAMSLTPNQLAAAICAHLPDFEIDYRIDPVRQAIADSWPRSLDDSAARLEWGWRPRWDLPAMTRDMLEHLRSGVPVG